MENSMAKRKTGIKPLEFSLASTEEMIKGSKRALLRNK